MIWILIALLVIFLIVSTYVNYIVIKQNLLLEDQRESLVDQIEESLEIFDVCYDRACTHAEIPVLSDEPMIKEVVSNLQLVRNAILAIASKVVTYGADEDEDGN